MKPSFWYIYGQNYHVRAFKVASRHCPEGTFAYRNPGDSAPYDAVVDVASIKNKLSTSQTLHRNAAENPFGRNILQGHPVVGRQLADRLGNCLSGQAVYFFSAA